jgi:hypothetical protein
MPYIIAAESIIETSVYLKEYIFDSTHAIAHSTPLYPNNPMLIKLIGNENATARRTPKNEPITAYTALILEFINNPKRIINPVTAFSWNNI